MFRKYRERRVRSPLYLMLVFIFLTLALISLTTGLAEAAITGYFMEIYRISLPLAYSLVVLADFALYIFATYMTNRGQKLIPFIIIIGIFIMIALFLPWNWWGVPNEDYTGKLSIRLYTTSSFVIFSCAIYAYIIAICKMVLKTSESKVTKTGLKLLIYGMICLILLFICITGDNLLVVLFDHPGYSAFLYVGWLFAVGFVILSYLSLVMPDWLVRRIE